MDGNSPVCIARHRATDFLKFFPFPSFSIIVFSDSTFTPERFLTNRVEKGYVCCCWTFFYKKSFLFTQGKSPKRHWWRTKGDGHLKVRYFMLASLRTFFQQFMQSHYLVFAFQLTHRRYVWNSLRYRTFRYLMFLCGRWRRPTLVRR